MEYEENKAIKKKSKYVIDKDTAENDFIDFCEEWEIDYEIDDMTDEDKEGFENQKDKIVKAIMRGRMAFDRDTNTMNYTFSDKSEKQAGETIKIARPKGASYMDMDGYKDTQLIRKTYAVLASMTRKSISYFANIDGIDLKPLQAIITLFLAG